MGASASATTGLIRRSGKPDRRVANMTPAGRLMPSLDGRSSDQPSGSRPCMSCRTRGNARRAQRFPRKRRNACCGIAPLQGAGDRLGGCDRLMWREELHQAEDDRSSARDIDEKLQLRRAIGITEQRMQNAAQDAVVRAERERCSTPRGPCTVAISACSRKATLCASHTCRHEADQHARSRETDVSVGIRTRPAKVTKLSAAPSASPSTPPARICHPVAPLDTTTP